MSDNKFQLNTDDVLGLQYSQFISNIRGVAIANPAEYYKLRAQLMQTVKRDAVGALYNSIFNVLTKGVDINNQPIQAPGGSVVLGRGEYVPQYPSQKTNDFAIHCASILAEHLNKVVDILLPDEFESIASKKLAIKGASKAIDISP